MIVQLFKIEILFHDNRCPLIILVHTNNLHQHNFAYRSHRLTCPPPPAPAPAYPGHVGLVNQAMTCYLNSLLQTLFMTPEFRNAMYSWEYDGTSEDSAKSIPFQLQKLFVNMQVAGWSDDEGSVLV